MMTSLFLPLLCLAAVFGFGSTQSDLPCSLEHMLVMKKEWAVMFNNMTVRRDVMIDLWARMFFRDPSFEEFFKNDLGMDTAINSSDLLQFSSKVMSGFDICVSILDEPQVLEHQLLYLRKKHQGRRLPPKYFRYFLSTLLQSVKIVTGVEINKLAWASCGTFIIEGMQDPAEKYLS